MKNTEIQRNEVFSELAKKAHILCVDFQKIELLDLSGCNIEQILRLTASQSTRFYVIKEEE